MVGLVRDAHDSVWRILAAADQLPECRIAGGIGNQVNSLVRGGVDNIVQAPVIEYPGFARSHVHAGPVTMKTHFLARRHGNMQSNSIEPMVIDVGMRRHGRPRGKPQQSRTTPRYAEACQHLPHIRRVRQVSSLAHDSIDEIVLAAAHADEAHRTISGYAVWMSRPCSSRYGGDFFAQARDVKTPR